MGEINMSRNEEAVGAIDINALKKLIDQCIREGFPTALYPLGLAHCGPYVATKNRDFEQALARHGTAKSSKKRAETEHYAVRAGDDLVFAVQQMKDRLDREREEGLLFYVEDQIIPPYQFSEDLSVRVSYRWRRNIEDVWSYGSIVFSHHVDLRPDYTLPPPKRKPSAAQLRRDRQDQLYRTWEHLKGLALHSVRGYFRSGGSGNSIPATFAARTETYRGELNNHSADFWRERS